MTMTHYKVTEDSATVFVPVEAVESVHYEEGKTILVMKDGSKRFADFDVTTETKHAVEKWAGINNQVRVEKDGNVFYVSRETGRPAGTED